MNHKDLPIHSLSGFYVFTGRRSACVGASFIHSCTKVKDQNWDLGRLSDTGKKLSKSTSNPNGDYSCTYCKQLLWLFESCIKLRKLGAVVLGMRIN